MKLAPCAIIFALLFAHSAVADYRPTYFADLAATSEVVAAGTIVGLEDETFTLKIDDVIAGPVKTGDTITVRRFRDWPCAWRWTKYERGQRVFVFLNGDNHSKTPQYYIRGAGGEGESPIERDMVLGASFASGETVTFETVRGRVHLQRLSYETVRSAVVDFRATYRLHVAREPWKKMGGESVLLKFDRIEKLPPPAQQGAFRPRPTRTNPRQTIPFAQRSQLHKELVEWVDYEQQRIAKYHHSLLARDAKVPRETTFLRNAPREDK